MTEAVVEVVEKDGRVGERKTVVPNQRVTLTTVKGFPSIRHGAEDNGVVTVEGKERREVHSGLVKEFEVNGTGMVVRITHLPFGQAGQIDY